MIEEIRNGLAGVSKFYYSQLNTFKSTFLLKKNCFNSINKQPTSDLHNVHLKNLGNYVTIK